MTKYSNGSESVDGVAQRLMVEFDGILSKRQVAGTVLQAVAELDGEVPPGALPQMLHQLAHQRLDSSIPEVWPISATPADRR